MSILSVNEGYRPWWKENTRKYIDYLKAVGEDRPYLCRYVGSLVADFHRDLVYGGIFLYPENEKNPDQPLSIRLTARNMTAMIAPPRTRAWRTSVHITAFNPPMTV